MLAPSHSARAFTVSPTDALAAARLTAALREVRDVGVAEIARAVAERADEVISLADSHGIPLATPRDAARRAGIVALAPDPGDAAHLPAALANDGITFTARSGLIRIAVHAGTTEATMRMLVDALATAASARVW
ncbi:hypothetical protein GCM10009778_21560 [Microbacterium terricola]